MYFKCLEIQQWKQFERVHIDFHENVTILTGANGAGKTTLLNILAKHFGWEFHELATPKKDEDTGFFRFFTRWFKVNNIENQNEIGKITYDDDLSLALLVPEQDSAQYSVQIAQHRRMSGVNIPSHRPLFFYEKVSHIATQKINKQQAYDSVKDSKYNRLLSNSFSHTPNYFIKEALLNWAIGGSGNEFIQADLELREYFLEFQEVLKQTLPKSLGFKKLTIRNYEIVFETDTGEFMLDAVSGGVSAIIDLVWSIYTHSHRSSNSVVLIDEIENHLHATLQRAILPSLISAFPNIQFIVSTHSPLIIGSVKSSNVYAFRYNAQNRVFSEKLDLVNKAKSANEVLNEVLGVPFSMPIWVETELERIVDKYSSDAITPDIFRKMRKELKEKGLESLMPWTMDKTLEKLDGKNN